MKWFVNVKNWVLSWFTDENKLRLLQFLNGMQVFVDWAYPIVKEIDEKLKPLLKGGTPVVEALTKFFEEYVDDLDEVVDLVHSLKDLPLADMLANVAIELLKLKSGSNIALSVLRLAVELAYNLYKQADKPADNFSYVEEV